MIEKPRKAARLFSAVDGTMNVLNEDICLPIAVIKQQALTNNINWMQSYADHCQVSLAPHGKTTMTPAIFKQQMAGGAWGIGVATVDQAQVALEAGVPNIIMANQLVGRANMRLMTELKRQSSAHFYCCVDNKDNALQLSQHFVAADQQLNVLIELGIRGGRCGCRTVEEAEELALYIAQLPGLTLAGVEFYEGIIHSDNEQADQIKINQFLQRVIETCQRLIDKNLFADQQEIILTGAGSVWYDLVCHELQQADLPKHMRYVIRPGCYITHDQGIYQASQAQLRQRNTVVCDLAGDLVSALELCAYVQSLPEPGLAIIGFGKRDAAFDAGLPQPIGHYRLGESQTFISGSMKTVEMMDQHAMLSYSSSVNLQVGDILIFATSHPCLTFDKWRKLYLVDEQYNVLQEIATFF